MPKKATSRKQAAQSEQSAKRTYLKQSDVPSASLDDALRVPQALLDHYAGKPTLPLYVAKALNVDPNGSQLKVLTGAAIAFGLTEGGAQATSIAVTDLARRILRPKEEGADIAGRREAVLLPRVFGEFLRNYDGHPFPRPDIARNVLEGMGVPRDKTAEVLERIETTARSVGFLEQIKDKTYVALQGAAAPVESDAAPEGGTNEIEPPEPEPESQPTRREPARGSVSSSRPPESALAVAIADDERRRRVFITHGKNRDLVEPIKKLLEFGEMIPVVSVERTSVSKPVPEKVMDDMRACGAAIIHVDAEQTVTDAAGASQVVVNPNVLIEIGAAMAFYGRRFILLVRDGIKLPSNLQGLFEVRYTVDALDAAATIKLLEAIKDIKNYGLPTDPPAGDS